MSPCIERKRHTRLDTGVLTTTLAFDLKLTELRPDIFHRMTETTEVVMNANNDFMFSGKIGVPWPSTVTCHIPRAKQTLDNGA